MYGIWINSPQLEDHHYCPSKTNQFLQFARFATGYHVALAVHGGLEGSAFCQVSHDCTKCSMLRLRLISGQYTTDLAWS